MAIDRTWVVTAGEVRGDFVYLRALLRDAERLIRTLDSDTDLSDSGEAVQLACDIEASASSFGAWLASERRKRDEGVES